MHQKFPSKKDVIVVHIYGMDHVDVTVPNIEKSAEFFIRALNTVVYTTLIQKKSKQRPLSFRLNASTLPMVQHKWQ